MSFLNAIGSVSGLNLFTGTPFSSHKNLLKFHFKPLPNIPPVTLCFKNAYNGCVSLPFSHTNFPRIGNVAPLASFAKEHICSLEDGSWPPKLLHGKARISKPFDLKKTCVI
jgi:hypothetical protein